MGLPTFFPVAAFLQADARLRAVESAMVMEKRILRYGAVSFGLLFNLKRYIGLKNDCEVKNSTVRNVKMLMSDWSEQQNQSFNRWGCYKKREQRRQENGWK